MQILRIDMIGREGLRLFLKEDSIKDRQKIHRTGIGKEVNVDLCINEVELLLSLDEVSDYLIAPAIKYLAYKVNKQLVADDPLLTFSQDVKKTVNYFQCDYDNVGITVTKSATNPNLYTFSVAI